jgi:hypothetical protein
MRWAGNVACIGVRRDAYRILVEKPEGKKDHLADLGVYERIIL